MPYWEADVPPASRRALEGFGLLSRKWHPVIVVTLSHHDALGFNDLLDRIPAVSSKVLTDSLEDLQSADLVEREVIQRSPRRVEYSLTEAGSDLQPVIDEFAAWGEEHLETQMPRVLIVDGDRRITDMYRQWLTDRYVTVRAHDDAAVEKRFDDSIDVVLLDDSVPGVDVHDRARRYAEDARVVVLVGGRPDFALLELQCDDLLRKPLVRETALAVVEEQLTRRGEPDAHRELASLRARESLFEVIYTPERLASSSAFQRLVDRRATLEERVRTAE